MNDDSKNETPDESHAMPSVWSVMVRVAIALVPFLLLFCVVNGHITDVVWPLSVAVFSPLVVIAIALIFLRWYPAKFAACLNTGVCLAVVSSLFIFIMILHSNDLPRQEERQAQCISNLKQLQLGVIMYCQDYEGSFPPSKSWNDTVYFYTKTRAIYFCPDANNKDMPSYALNGQLVGRNAHTLANAEILVGAFESFPGKNRSGGPELLPNPDRHRGGNIVAFIDGHAKWIPQKQESNLVWKDETAHGKP